MSFIRGSLAAYQGSEGGVYPNVVESGGGGGGSTVTIERSFQPVLTDPTNSNPANVVHQSTSFNKIALLVDGGASSVSTWTCQLNFTTNSGLPLGDDVLFVFPPGSITGTLPQPSPGFVAVGVGYPTVVPGSDGRTFNANWSANGAGGFSVSLKDYIRPSANGSGSQISFNFTF